MKWEITDETALKLSGAVMLVEGVYAGGFPKECQASGMPCMRGAETSD
jgi:hypothetical protein